MEILEIIRENALKHYDKILIVNSTFTGTLLVIFFTLISLPLQNVLGRYSQDLVNHVKKDRQFLFYFYLLSFTFIYNLALFVLPQQHWVIYSALGSGIAPVFILIFLTRRVFYLLDIRNQLRDIAKDIKKQIVQRIREAEATQTRTAKNRPSPLSDIGMRYRKRKIDPTVTKWLKEKCDIIFDVVQKAVQENRFEIVEGGLETIVDLTRGYVARRKEYRSGEDDFITYIRNRLIDTKNLVTTTTHPKVMDSIIKTAGEIAKETLKIESIGTTYGRNFLPYGFVLLLKDIALSEEILKETSYAPMDVCTQLAEIGTTAIDMGAPIMTAAIAQELSEISKRTTKMHFFYTDYIAAKANDSIAHLLYYTLNNLRKISPSYRRDILEEIKRAINESIEAYFKDSRNHYRVNINSIVGPAAPHGIARILLQAIKQATENRKIIYNDVVEFVKTFLNDLKRHVLLGIQENKRNDTINILLHICAIGATLIQDLNKLKDDKLKNDVQQIIEGGIFEILHDSITVSFDSKNRENPVFWKSLNAFSFLIGIAFIESIENENDTAIRIAEKEIRKMLELMKSKKDGCDEIKLLCFYRYLWLFGSWLFKWMPKSTLLHDIKETLKNQLAISSVRKAENFLSMLESEWHIKKAGVSVLTEKKMSQKLFNLLDTGYIKEFENFLTNKS